MATENTPVPIRTAQASQVAPILDFSQWLAGSRTDTTARTTGQTAQLEALLAQALDPKNLENLVANLFSQGAAQVPGLTSQFANATGTRVSNNSMLSQSLAALNQSLAQAVAQAVQQQQQVAMQGAGQLAQANKTTTQRAGTQPGNLGRAILPTVIGSVLNRIGKSQTPTTPPAGDAGPTITGAPAFPDYETGVPGQEFIPANMSGDGIQGMPSLDFINGTPDISATPDLEGVDYGYDYFDLPELDIAESLPDLSGLSDIDIPGWFRDGGYVRAKGYADGGQVRGRPDMGPRPQPQRTMALHVPSQVTRAARRSPRQQADMDVESQGPSAVSPNTSFASPATIANISSMVTPSNVSMGFTGLGMLGMSPQAIAVTAVTKGIQMALTQMMQMALNLPIPPEDEMMPAPPMPPAIPDPVVAESGVSAMPAAVMPGFAEVFGLESMGFESEGSPAGAGEGGGFGDAEGIGATTGIGGESAEGGVGDSGDGGSSGDGDGAAAGDGDGWADGGMVDRWGQKRDYVPRKGQAENDKKKKKKSEYLNPPQGIIRGEGTPTSDSILARVSVDEYILPASTVAAIGKHTLDQIVAATHTPVDEGTNG